MEPLLTVVTDKLTRTWRGLASRIRRWGHIALGGCAAVLAPLLATQWVGSMFQTDEASALLRLLAPAGVLIAGSGLFALFAGVILGLSQRVTNSGVLQFDQSNQTLVHTSDEERTEIPVTTVKDALVLAPTSGSVRGQLLVETEEGSEYRFTLPAKDAKQILKRAGLDPRRRRSRVQLSTVRGAVWAISGGILAVPTFLIAIFYLLSPMFYADAAGWGMYGNGSFGDEMFGLVGAICLLPLLWNVIASWLGVLLRPFLGTTLHIGSDGITLEKGWQKRFISFREIESLEFREATLAQEKMRTGQLNRSREVSGRQDAQTGEHTQVDHLTTLHGHRGTPEVIPQLQITEKSGETHTVFLDTLKGNLTETVRARLEGALEDKGQLLLPRLHRGDVPEEEWQRELAKLFSQKASYRHAPASKEQVMEVLQNDRAPAEQRLAAAIALSGSDDPNAKRTLVRVSEGLVDPALRGPLVKIAEEAKADLLEVEHSLASPAHSAKGT